MKAISSRNMDDLYFVASSKNYVSHKKLIRAKGKMEFEFKITLNKDLITTCSITIYYLHESGEVIFDVASVNFPEPLKNQVRYYLKYRNYFTNYLMLNNFFIYFFNFFFKKKSLVRS